MPEAFPPSARCGFDVNKFIFFEIAFLTGLEEDDPIDVFEFGFHNAINPAGTSVEKFDFIPFAVHITIV